MALFCSPCKFPIHSFQSRKRFSIGRSFATKSLFLKHCSTSSSSGPSFESRSEFPPTAIIFVKGLAKSTSEGSLRTAFSQCGDISRVKIVTDKKTRESLGFAYIWFGSEVVAQSAVEEMNGKFLEGRFIYVTMARPGSCKTHVKATHYKF